MRARSPARSRSSFPTRRAPRTSDLPPAFRAISYLKEWRPFSKDAAVCQNNETTSPGVLGYGGLERLTPLPLAALATALLRSASSGATWLW